MTSNGLPVVLFVIRLIESVSTARHELPLLLSNSPKSSIITPASTKGSNTIRSTSQQQKPVAVIFGGGFTPDEFEELRKLEGGEKVPWLKADNSLVPESEV
ncbi:hypothetical protein DL95DRAFT_481498 [Leptodontidium sp. 2 PMI_412]|nr:hypothetical protein DL95DRAFT_481498 [Leptodontidium sp. 2 PMI_412]